MYTKYVPIIAASAILVCVIIMWRDSRQMKQRTTDLVNQHNNLVREFDSHKRKLTELSVQEVPFEFAPSPIEDMGGEIVEVSAEAPPEPEAAAASEPAKPRAYGKRKKAVTDAS